MANLLIYDRTGKEVGTYEIDPAELAPRINKQLLHDAVVMYQANRRQGSHRSKSRGEVSGSTKKMYRQKGHGQRPGRVAAKRCSAGWRSHPRPAAARLLVSAAPQGGRSWRRGWRLPRKFATTRWWWSTSCSSTRRPRRKWRRVLKALGLGQTSTLIATDAHDVNVYKSARNIARVTISPVSDLNALSVLAPERMLVTRKALDRDPGNEPGQRATDAEPAK